MKQALSKIIGAGIIVAAVSADAISKEEAVGAAGLERDGITLSSPDQPYAVDALKYGARTFTKATIDAAVAALGTTNKATLLLRPGIWMINANADWSAYVNITFKMAPGTVISHETYSVKIPNPDAGWHPWLSGTGTVTISGNQRGLCPQWFGAKGNGVTDDKAAIQTFLEVAFRSGFNPKFPTAVYGVGSTLIVPPNNSGRVVEIDGGNSSFLMVKDVTLFTSGYYSGSTLVTNYGTAGMSHPSLSGIVLKNFTIASKAGNLTATALKIQDWHLGSSLENIYSNVTDSFLHSNNNFYMNFNNLHSIFNGTGTVPRFVFLGEHNLNKITGLVAANSTIGYRFDGPVTALQFTNNSIEGMTTGVQFNSSVYDVALENNYAEAVTGTVFDFTDYVHAATIRNNYIVFGATTYLIDLLPGPANNIIIEADNCLLGLPNESHVIKKREDSYSGGITIKRFPVPIGAALSELLVDNRIYGNQVKWEGLATTTGMTAQVVNKYAVGNYSGKFTGGYEQSNGFRWVDNRSAVLTIATKMVHNQTELIYVNLEVAYTGGHKYIKGVFVGTAFYEFTGTGLELSTQLVSSVVGGFIQINGRSAFPATVTGCKGEVRLI